MVQFVAMIDFRIFTEKSDCSDRACHAMDKLSQSFLPARSSRVVKVACDIFIVRGHYVHIHQFSNNFIQIDVAVPCEPIRDVGFIVCPLSLN